MEIFKSSVDGNRNLQEFQICFIILNVVGSKEPVLKTVYFTLESSKLKGSVASKRPAGSKAERPAGPACILQQGWAR